jgi:hypothetical protein
MAARFPKEFGRRVAVLRERPGSPYSTNSDVLRDAAYIGMQVLVLRYQQPDWKAEDEMARMAADMAEDARIGEKVTRFATLLQEIWMSDKQEAYSRLKNYCRAVSSMQNPKRRIRYWQALSSAPTVTMIAAEAKIDIPPKKDSWEVDDE